MPPLIKALSRVHMRQSTKQPIPYLWVVTESEWVFPRLQLLVALQAILLVPNCRVHMCIHAYTCVRIHAYTCVSVYLCLDVYVCIHTCPCVCLCIHACIHVCAFLLTHLCMCIHTFTCVCMCSCLHTYVCIMIYCSQDQLSRRLTLAPGEEEITMVTWEELEQVISDGWRASKGVNKRAQGSGVGRVVPQQASLVLSLSHILVFGPSLLTSCILYCGNLKYVSKTTLA